MARKNISKIIDAFQAGRAAQDATCRTDGKVVWSYAMPIAFRGADGVVMVVRGGPSRTTNGQINAVAAAFPKCERVDEIKVTAEGCAAH